MVSNMCSSPILLPNPYKGLGHIKANSYKDTKNKYIRVPCGKCLQCLSNKQNFYNQRIQMESLRSHLFMLTLTYNEEMLPRIDYLGYQLNFADFCDIQKMFKRIRARGYKFRYFIVSEYGKHRRAHFHAIIAVEKTDIHPSVIEQTFYKLFSEEWRCNVGIPAPHISITDDGYTIGKNHRNPEYKRLYTHVRRGRKCNYDFHRIIHVPNKDNDCAFYVTKYMMKGDKTTQKLLHKIKHDPTLSHESVELLCSLIKPQSKMSKDFGDKREPRICSHILDNLSIYQDIPQFADIYSGHTSMLSRYYRPLVPLEYYEFHRSQNKDGMATKGRKLDYAKSLRANMPIFVNCDSPSNHLDDTREILDYRMTADKAFRSDEKLKKIQQMLDDY